MRTLGNIIWHFPFLGFLSALLHLIIGELFIISIVGAPIGLGIVQYSNFLWAPFSHAMVSKSDLGRKQNTLWLAYSFLVWIVYLPIGIILCIITIFQIVGQLVSIVGIPMAIVLAKSLGTYFKPVNKICVHVVVRDEIEKKKAFGKYGIKRG